MSFSDTFYFVIFTSKARTTIKVIDLAYASSYERSEWLAANEENFDTPEDAIEHAKALAAKFNLMYVPFESRYNSELDEKDALTLD